MKALFRLHAAIVMLLFLAIATAAKAQPCTAGAVTVNNPTGFTVTICLIATPAIPCITVPPGLGVAVPIANPTKITGVTSAAGIPYAWVANPTPPPASILPGIALPPTGNCFDITYDPTTCTINVAFSGFPPCLRP